ncbi:MAG: metallophosphoesterase [Prolixibacteraceae bacterium]|nr:metallophosphoesterase [Prolixibacteraceae bacterium]
MRTIFFLVALMLFACSPEKKSDPEPYSFFVAGHTYGQPGVNNIGLHPPFKQKFSCIQSRSEIKFGILTGDIAAPVPTAKDWDEVDADIDSLGIPVYFAVGNHDMKERDLYEERYGDTYYHFIFNNDLFIVLDPNMNNWNISGKQLSFLKNVVNDN